MLTYGRGKENHQMIAWTGKDSLKFTVQSRDQVLFKSLETEKLWVDQCDCINLSAAVEVASDLIRAGRDPGDIRIIGKAVEFIAAHEIVKYN